MEIMWSYPPSQYSISHWKCVLGCSAKFPHIDLTSQELDEHHSSICTTISFYVYRLIAQCTVHVKHKIYEKNVRLCLRDITSVPPAKLYAWK